MLQGRCKYLKPVDPNKKNPVGEDGEEEEEADDGVEPEDGPPLLTSLQKDPGVL